METINELEDLSNKIKTINSKYSKQINALESDFVEFHKIIIDLSAKNPKSKELLEFIVFINDKMDTKQTNFKQIISETLEEINSVKQELIKIVIKSRKEQIKNKIFNVKINSFSDAKWLIASAIIFLFLIGILVDPNSTLAVLEWLKKIKL